jgi:secretion protein hlyD family protein
MKKKNIIGLLVTIAVFAVVLVLSIYFFSNREPVYLQGQVEAKQINVAPKVPGRVKAIYKQEGDQVHKGDLLLELESTELDAKLSQAEAARLAAQAQSDKAQRGARSEQIQGAYNVWQQAQAAAELAEKTYQRVSNHTTTRYSLLKRKTRLIPKWSLYKNKPKQRNHNMKWLKMGLV